MSVTPVPPKPPLAGQSEVFAAKAKGLNAADKATATNPHNALAGRNCSVGPGNSRAKAQSEGTTIKGLITSLSNGFTSVVHGAKNLCKSATSYVFRPSQPEAPLQPKKAMTAILGAAGQGVDTVTDFLNRTPAIKDAYRGVRDALNPPKSTMVALGREASDAITDIKSAEQGLMDDVGKFFKKLF
ncbi:hypothetical protein [Acidovorax sp. CCYZU-2555]|uniref:hypothetical protein n=1 Tax=Acidovorax sp. CCYZU-2555 TaxID=2835042 RepID=UPI001BCC8633|nr:hypothetical protein [Acidovorax sp. CCYZU-2555]MBS7779609.1 hypothetical protein [Acidovorax sp. CCYZU-2555]